MDRDELKPCPFCGGAAKFDQIEMQVQCRTRGCTGQSWMFDTLAEAIAAWNTRLQPSVDGEPVAVRLANIVRGAGYWNAEIILGTDGGHDVTLRTKEGYDAVRALAGKDAEA